MMPYFKIATLPDIKTTLDDPATSYWLRDALRASLNRDPVDAANDAACLAGLLAARAANLGALSI